MACIVPHLEGSALAHAALRGQLSSREPFDRVLRKVAEADREPYAADRLLGEADLVSW